MVAADSAGIWSWRTEDTPIAVFDFETTGLSAGLDRVVEVAVVRIDPGDAPRVVLDTLIKPGRRVAATEIHGITDRDVARAPTFAEIAGAFLRSVDGCVLAGYNVYFDMRFLSFELAKAGRLQAFPHLCFMQLQPMLGLGDRCALGAACGRYGIETGMGHCARDDTLATAHLWGPLRQRMAALGITTFGELARGRSNKFLGSFQQAPASFAVGEPHTTPGLMPRDKARKESPSEPVPRRPSMSHMSFAQTGAPDVCFTGFQRSERQLLEREASGAGFTVRTTVTSDLAYLCTGPNAGPAKVAKARTQNTSVLVLEEFRRLLHRKSGR